MKIPARGTPVPHRLVSSKEMAKILQCSEDTLRRYRKDGIIKNGVYKKRGTLRYDPTLILEQLGER